MNADDTSPIRTAPLALWRVAQAFLGVLHMLFGSPEAVAARHTLTAKAHAHMASWLRCAEAMLRRLIVIEAGALPKPNTRPLLNARRSRARKPVSFTPDQPEAWRVSFRCFTPLRQPRIKSGGDAEDRAASSVSVGLSLSKAKRPEARRFRSAWPLAERYEALLRVFNDPSAYARRVSRRLYALPHRLGEPLRAPPEAQHRVDDFEALGEQARAVWRLHFSSS